MVRISFSNLFKEFKSTATWLQFPFICGAAKGLLHDSTARASRQGKRWPKRIIRKSMGFGSGVMWVRRFEREPSIPPAAHSSG